MNKNIFFLTLCAIFLIILPSILLAEVRGTVIEVKTAETVVIQPLEGGLTFVCRLYGIDAPEKYQPYGPDAVNALKSLVLDQIVEVKTTGQKSYDREICFLHQDRTDINLEMIRQGYAWAYRKYLKEPYESKYVKAELEARSMNLGLWADPTPVAPWEWRRFKRERRR